MKAPVKKKKPPTKKKPTAKPKARAKKPAKKQRALNDIGYKQGGYLGGFRLTKKKPEVI